MVKRTLLGLAPAAAVLAIAGCGGSSSGRAPASGAKSGLAPTGITIAHGKLGAYLADSKGRALYLFEADKGASSTCYSACASIWPPLTSTGATTPGAGVARMLLGTTKRSDVASEVTFHGHPLYYYVGDATAGSTAGQGLDQFGAKWYLVAPDGSKLGTGG
jgi:predicted lipoprotein with Yx(FWY)xxD motif